MELSRRDAMAALAAAGATAGGAAVLSWDRLSADRRFDGTERDQLVALARVLYPSAVDGVPSFVERYVVGRVRDRPAYGEGMRTALADLDHRARDWRDAPWLALSPDGRDELLREMGVDDADPDPEGLDFERVRYYLVNELLYALYTSPTGGKLVGIENPIAHPGGLASYQRPPDDPTVERGSAHGGDDG